MRIVFIGPPGAGKGTQSVRLAEALGVTCLSTGEVLRAVRESDTPAGREIAARLDAGKLVSDDLVLRIVGDRLAEADCQHGYLFDGFPRTLPQAVELDKMLDDHNSKLDAVILFEIDEDELFRRLASRGRSDDNEQLISETAARLRGADNSAGGLLRAAWRTETHPSGRHARRSLRPHRSRSPKRPEVKLLAPPIARVTCRPTKLPTYFPVTVGQIELKSNREIGRMRQAGIAVWQAHQIVTEMIAPGVTTKQIDTAIEAHFDRLGATPLFKNYPHPDLEKDKTKPPFPAVTCTSVNEAVVHGIPNNTPLSEGDIVSIDTGCRLNGWCGDAAATYAVGEISADAQRLLRRDARDAQSGYRADVQQKPMEPGRPADGGLRQGPRLLHGRVFRRPRHWTRYA